MRKKLFTQASGKQRVNEGIDHDCGIASPQGLWAPRKDVKQVRWKDTRAIINATMKVGTFHTYKRRKAYLTAHSLLKKKINIAY